MNGVLGDMKGGEVFVYVGIGRGVRRVKVGVGGVGVSYVVVGVVRKLLGGWVRDVRRGIFEKKMGIEVEEKVEVGGGR